MSARLPDLAMLATPASLGVRISPAMVTRFAALTGDQSNLHVDEGFARRSSYRQPVVHGMLPVACLALLPPLRVAGFRSVLRGLTGRFTAPVIPGDALTIHTAAATKSGDRLFDVAYQIARERTVVTSGTLTVSYEPVRPMHPSPPAGTSAMLVSPVQVRTFQLEDAPRGTSDQLDFAIGDATVSELAGLIAEGAREPVLDTDDIAAHVDLPNLAGVLLYSTSIGVSLPGASATFLEFSAHIEEPVQLGHRYRLLGTVTHRSESTRILKKELLVKTVDRDTVLIRGKASTLVAKPFSRMPSVEDLQRHGTELGVRSKVVIVTGASRGIGETTAKLLAVHGAKVVVNYHRGADDAARVVAEIVEAGGEAVGIRADISNAEDVQALVRGAQERFGAVHVLVNNAARDYRPVPFLDLTWAEMQKDIDVIVKGAFLCCQAVLPIMLTQGEGRIISISTVATDNPPSHQTKYVVAKSALVGLTRSLSIEFAARNIQANLVVPNFVETDFVAHIPEGFRKKIAQDIPMQRAASALDVARAVVFLASDYASFTTGQKLMVTGGGAPYL